MAAIVGKKLGMTRIFLEDGTAVPVTVIEAAPNKVTAIRKADRDGYDAVQLAAIPVAEDRLTKAEAGHLKKAGAAGHEDPGRVPGRRGLGRSTRRRRRIEAEGEAAERLLRC